VQFAKTPIEGSTGAAAVEREVLEGTVVVVMVVDFAVGDCEALVGVGQLLLMLPLP